MSKEPSVTFTLPPIEVTSMMRKDARGVTLVAPAVDAILAEHAELQRQSRPTNPRKKDRRVSSLGWT